jgi:DUF971 family protein
MPIPSQIHLHKRSQKLELVYADARFELPAEYLRVFSPSAEVKGHGPGQETLQWGKKHVAVTGIEPQGHYAIKLVFNDGHDSGIYTWDYLYELGARHEEKWQDYLQRLAHAKKSRDPEESVVRFLE